MSKYDDDMDDLDGVTELTFIDPSRVDGVMTPATGSTFLVLKSRAAESKSKFGRKLSPTARAAFGENAEAVRRGKRLKSKTGKAKKRRRGAGLVASKAASVSMSYSQEIPATGCANESASIMAAVTGERTGGVCSARTASGTPCMRPSVNGARCHLHA